jgi:hypothetical protein
MVGDGRHVHTMPERHARRGGHRLSTLRHDVEV